MQLAEILYQKTNDALKPLVQLCGGCPDGTRKDDLVRCIHRVLMTPESLRQMWQQLDEVSRKAVASAYHNDGYFDKMAFTAQYGELPERPQSRWFWQQQPILLDLFLYEGQLPDDLKPLLEPLVPLPERFQLQGLANTPSVIILPYGGSIPLICAETEQTGQHDLMAYLRLVDQGQIKISASSSRATLGSLKKVLTNLLEGDFFALPDTYRATDTIRPFGLDVFVQESGLAAKARGRNELRLTSAGQEFFQSQDPALLLEAFQTWTEQGSFEELSRISVLKGLKAKATRLTRPAVRRDAIIEALSWCPVDVWINIQDFYRALKIWHFDFEVETGYYSNLYIGSADYGTLHGETYWHVVKGLYVNAVLFEYLGSIGALDLLYTQPEDSNLEIHSELYYDDLYLSVYDGLSYFRINHLGAYLLGQAGEYIPAIPLDRALFSIAANLQLNLIAPNELTPNDQYLLEQMAAPLKKNMYRLDLTRLLTALETGQDLQQLAEFLKSRHAGPLPAEVTAWLAKAEQHSQAFKLGEQALLIKAQSPDLIELIMADSVLQKYCYRVTPNTVAVPVSKEKAFRNRLKTLEYVLL